MDWISKREHCKTHQVKRISKKIADMPSGSLMLIANTKILDEYIKDIPKGDFISTKKIRIDLAKQFGCDVTCPLTTGIFIRIISEAAYQEYKNGNTLSSITPFWRVVNKNSNLAHKLACGVSFIVERQKYEKINY